MRSDEKAREIISAVVDIIGVDVGDKRPQLETFLLGHLDAIERAAAEKAVNVYRQKTTEATDKLLSETTIAAPVGGPEDALEKQQAARRSREYASHKER